ncbi:hypothetical protein COU36_00865 [Candidatus Micrarchaeota archaeon CG10_big_fil_rev_8_21_14_0_10_59_7]|nr:MAG: hypothetical protein COU36_00865 [Candidatus Micrarchaeota archaeon CG10_big_fil_rev_8_21_14_0_10_59_7]
MAFLDVLAAAALVFAATTAGAAAVFAFLRVGTRAYAVLLSFSAGVMAYSSVEMLGEAHATLGDFWLFAVFLVGVIFLFTLEKSLPHIHPRFRGNSVTLPRKPALIAGSVTLHNIPEGLAIASAFAGSPALGWTVASAMALQDVPEGLMVSAPLSCYGMRAGRCLKFGALSGAVEAVSAIIGYMFLASVSVVVPFGLAFSAGAMTYVVFVELLPDAFVTGQRRVAALSFFGGAACAFGLASVFIR